MKRVLQSFLFVCMIIVIIMGSATEILAHSGRTDSSGGHKDNQNKSGLGSYHYHCGGYPPHLHDNGYCPYTDILPYGVSISIDHSVLRINEEVLVSATVSPSNAFSKRVTWSVSDTSVVRIKGNTLTAVGYGTAYITATTVNGVVDSLQVTVKEVSAEKVSVGIKDWNGGKVYVDDWINMEAQTTPIDIDDPTITWKSTDTSVAEIDEFGFVTINGIGDTDIYATASNGISGAYYLVVHEREVESISLPTDSLELLVGDEYEAEVRIVPFKATYREIKWSTDDETVVSVSEGGLIIALNCGTAIVTATAYNGLSADIEINVSEIMAESIEILGDTSIELGSSIELQAVILPENTTDREVEWSVDNEDIACINDEGVVRPHQVGTVTVTARQKNVEKSMELSVFSEGEEELNKSLWANYIFGIGEDKNETSTRDKSDDIQEDEKIDSNDNEVIQNKKRKFMITQLDGKGITSTYAVTITISLKTALFGVAGVFTGIGGIFIVYKQQKKKGN